MTGSSSFPLRLASPDCFTRAAEGLRAAGYDEATLCRVMNITALSELATVKRAELDLAAVPASLATAIKVLLFGEVAARDEIEHALGADLFEALLELDLIRVGASAGGRSFAENYYYSPIFLYPVDGFLIASDRQSHADGSPFVTPQDMVFAAIFPGTLRFLRGISSRPAEDALDLCSGTGIGALKLSRHARRVVAGDITTRSAHFTRFNAALNGCANVEAATGDLYAAVEGRAFDRITAHPPYVPSLGDQMIFRDGGETGETILRRTVEGLPQFLRPGGTFYAMSVGLDTKEARFEERARRWLGGAREEFDVVFAAGDEKSPENAVRDIVERGQKIKTLDAGRLLRAFESLETVRLVYGALLIHRHKRAAKPWTSRAQLSPDTAGEDFDWCLDWHARRNEIGFVESLEEARPVLAPYLQVKTTHVVDHGTLVPAEFFLESSRPFATVTRIDAWVVPLVARFNGRLTAREVHEAAGKAGEIPASFGLAHFAQLIALLIERGCLALDEGTFPAS